MHVRTNKKTIVVLMLSAIVYIGFITSRDTLGRFVWNKYLFAKGALYLNRHDARLFMHLGNYYFGGKEYDLKKSRYAYERAVKIDPKILFGHYQLARINFIQSNFFGAIEEINKELEANHGNLRSLYIRGLIYAYQGRFDKAEEDFKKFILWAPKEWAGYNDLAWIQLKFKKYDDAKKTAATGIKEVGGGDENPWLWNSLGVAELNLKEFANAEQSFKKAQKYAENLTIQDWQKAYPGNHPADALSGLTQFRDGIDKNLEKTYQK